MNLKFVFFSLCITLLVVIQSCCFGSKEEHLGNNIYLSEYDNVDRRIMYQHKRCAVSGVEIIQMTILEIAHDEKWIIAKSGNKRTEGDYKFWVIKNQYEKIPDSETVKRNTIKFESQEDFEQFLSENHIGLKLRKID